MKAVGLRIKSGFAIAVIVSKGSTGCAIEAVHTVALSTQELPQTRFPFHPTIELPERQGAALSDQAVKEVRRIAAREMSKLLQESPGIKRAAMVVGSVIDPDSLGNPHVRVHALEGKLFREVVGEALAEQGIDCGVLVERDAYAKGSRRRIDPGATPAHTDRCARPRTHQTLAIRRKARDARRVVEAAEVAATIHHCSPRAVRLYIA